MLNERTYQTGLVTYRYRTAFKKWEFSWLENGVTQSLLLACPGRNVTAEHVAKLIDGSIDRKGVLDGLTRSNIYSLLAGAAARRE